MNNAEFQLLGVEYPRLAAHATSVLPAWLWSVDGTQVLWANPVGAKLLGAANAAALARKVFGPADAHRRQIVQLAPRLPSGDAIRLERLRGFGAPLAMLVTCSCARLDLPDGSRAVLVAAAETIGRKMPLIERLQRLVEDSDVPIAAFTREGMFVAASEPAQPWLDFVDLAEAGLDQARSQALTQGRAEAPTDIGHIVLQRVGTGADIGLIAVITPGARMAARERHVAAPSPQTVSPETEPQQLTSAKDRPPPDYEQPELSGEAPAEFTLIEAFTERPSQPGDLERARARTIEEAPMPETESGEPSPYVEAVADEPTASPVQEQPRAAKDSAPPPIASVKAPSWFDEPLPNARRHPLRFTWQMDAEGRFSLGSDEFTRLIGTRIAAGFGRLWSEIAEAFDLDPDGKILKAIATRDTWSGIALNWPVDGGGRLPVELSGVPIHDRARNFAGYRGFGVCRDLEGLARLAALRRLELFSDTPTPLSSDTVQTNHSKGAPAAEPAAASDAVSPATSDSPVSTAVENSRQTDQEAPVEPPKNILPFRPIGEPKPPALTPVESSAFNELARQISERLENGDAANPAASDTSAAGVEPITEKPETPLNQPEWLVQDELPAPGESEHDRSLLDLLPVGVLAYRLDRLLYANRAFFERMGYPSLRALEQAGGLGALYVESGAQSVSSIPEAGTLVTISAGRAFSEPVTATEARLFTISWDGDPALALIFTNPTAPADVPAINEPAIVATPPAIGHASAEELGAILDTTAEGIVMFDADGNINACNRSAEALFGFDGPEFVQRNLTELFAPESQRAVWDYLESIKGAGPASLLDHGREVLGRERKGGIIPISMTMGRTRPGGPNFFAVFRDLSQSRKGESELQQARRLADRAANAKADMLARISHEVRTPLNAIIGFAEVMIGERFGALGNERYVEYMKDIRASGERVIAMINDLLELSRIETGKLDLTFAGQNLNDLVEQCVAVMQPQANRERIIIRTSLAHALPPVIADARTLRQITLNLIANSIHLANVGGQVIVSTALSDSGDVVLRVRDTGHGLKDTEVAAAMEPFRTAAPSDQAVGSSPVNLSLTKALVEANRATFQIKSAPQSGTLVEVMFSQAVARP